MFMRVNSRCAHHCPGLEVISGRHTLGHDSGRIATGAPLRKPVCGWPSSTAPKLGVDSRHQPGLVSSFDTMARHTVPDLLPGTLDLLILRTLQTDSLHGWAISERIQQISQDVLQVNLVIVTSCALAVSVPALRAACIDPIATLRKD